MTTALLSYQLPQETQDTLLQSFIVVTFLLVFSILLLVFMCVIIDIGFYGAAEPLQVSVIISYIIRTIVLEHTRHTSALTVAQKHNETFQRNSTELKS